MPTFAAERSSIRQIQTGQTKSAILEAAQRLFSSRGYSETGVRDIAAEAGVNPALISRYFGSKQVFISRAWQSITSETSSGTVVLSAGEFMD